MPRLPADNLPGVQTGGLLGKLVIFLLVVTAPDRLARNYVHQVLLIEELAGHGCRVEFLDWPMSSDPHDQLLLQIRGAVAEMSGR